MTAEVAVEGAVAHRELALVGGVQEQGPVPVGVEHQDGAADAGLEILLGGVPVEVPLEERLGLLHEPVVDGADGDDVVFDSEIVG